MPDSEERKRRDKLLRTQDQEIADHLAAAERSGELRAAPSFGKPLADMAGYAETPGELRMPFKILKDAGVAPPELALFHERARLRNAVEAAGSQAEREAIAKKLADIEQVIALRLESLRARGTI